MTELSNTFVDTHCHLNSNAFDIDRKQVVDRALKNGVYKIVVPGMDLESSHEAIALAQEYSSIYAAVGFHPHYANQWTSSFREELFVLSKSPKVVAIGEIGLDYFRNFSSRKQQREAFQAQLEIATELNLPVIVHNREATSVIIEYLSLWSKKQKTMNRKAIGVLHAFSADVTVAFKAIDAGFLVGIAGPITFKNAEGLKEVAIKIPFNRLLIETDAPYLTPHPYRGKRNEPAYVTLVAEQLSMIKGQDIQTTARITSASSASLFGWNDGTNLNALH